MFWITFIYIYIVKDYSSQIFFLFFCGHHFSPPHTWLTLRPFPFLFPHHTPTPIFAPHFFFSTLIPFLPLFFFSSIPNVQTPTPIYFFLFLFFFFFLFPSILTLTDLFHHFSFSFFFSSSLISPQPTLTDLFHHFFFFFFSPQSTLTVLCLLAWIGGHGVEFGFAVAVGGCECGLDVVFDV